MKMREDSKWLGGGFRATVKHFGISLQRKDSEFKLFNDLCVCVWGGVPRITASYIITLNYFVNALTRCKSKSDVYLQ